MRQLNSARHRAKIISRLRALGKRTRSLKHVLHHIYVFDTSGFRVFAEYLEAFEQRVKDLPDSWSPSLGDRRTEIKAGELVKLSKYGTKALQGVLEPGVGYPVKSVLEGNRVLIELNGSNLILLQTYYARARKVTLEVEELEEIADYVEPEPEPVPKPEKKAKKAPKRLPGIFG